MDNTLIASISGIRGVFGRGLDAAALVRYSGAFAHWIRTTKKGGGTPTIVIGRDGRVTGEVCASIVGATLQSFGCSVIDSGMSTTPTVEMGVLAEQADGGIVLSASHNPAQWNALKLLNKRGEFLTPEEGQQVLAFADSGAVTPATYDQLGSLSSREYLDYHVDRILELGFIQPGLIAERGFRVLVDGVNSVGGIAIPHLLQRIGFTDDQIVRLNCEPTGIFSHDPEPLPQNLVQTIQAVREKEADLGIVVDPDADRLALVADGGQYVSEELTQVLAADFMWSFRPGPFVTNLSSSRAIDDVASWYGQEVYRSAVGETNVVQKMHEVGAVLGGEGNGGVILPDLHYGRDALVGVAVVLQHMCNTGRSLSELCGALPAYHIAKKKVTIGERDPDVLLRDIAERYRDETLSTIDGVKIDFESGWVHLRRSNTEPIMRVYAEGQSPEAADGLADRFIGELIGVGAD